MIVWMPKTTSIHAVEGTTPVHKPDRKPTVAISSQIASEADSRFCEN